MKTILVSVYALNPLKGSEEGMGWNFIDQIARFNKVIVITRKNNREGIERYMSERNEDNFKNIQFLYYDLPYYLRFWKKGSRGALLYFYLWQVALPLFVKIQNPTFDIVHNLNFHNDWTPSLLWTLGKPMILGPIGHHPKIPRKYILPIYGWQAYSRDRATWIMKQLFWKLDPLLKLTIYKAKFIWIMNSSVKKVINLNGKKLEIMPSVASENVEVISVSKHKFNVLSVGRFIPLKGFDVTIRSFAHFYHSLCQSDKENVSLTLVGKGPQKQLMLKICQQLHIKDAVTFVDWIERTKLKNIYRNSSVFLFPSHEGAGMVVSEAMSYGLPVLCFDNVGPGEFTDLQCARKVPYGNYNDSITKFSEYLMELFVSPTQLNKMSHQARRNFESNFDWNVRGDQLSAAYSDVFQEHDIYPPVHEDLSISQVFNS